MKKIITLLAVFISAFAFAQQASDVKVSKASSAKFKEMYPAAKGVTWSKDDQGRMVAHFQENNKNRWITIDEKNNWTNSLMEIDRSELPGDANDRLNQYFSDRTFAKTYKFIDETGRVFYEQDMETGEYVTGIIYDSNGVDFNKTSRLKNERPTRIQ